VTYQTGQSRLHVAALNEAAAAELLCLEGEEEGGRGRGRAARPHRGRRLLNFTTNF
jgi:hypothetical protein